MNIEKLLELRELAAKSTRVVGWYAHSQHDGYHPGKAAVRGPFGRWMLIEGGENRPGEMGEGVADLYDDAKFAAAAMNSLVPLLNEIDQLKADWNRQAAQWNARHLAFEREIRELKEPTHDS